MPKEISNYAWGHIFHKPNFLSSYMHAAWLTSLHVTLDAQVHHGRLSENESRRYFQQLIDVVSHCHSIGVYHRDLKVRGSLS